MSSKVRSEKLKGKEYEQKLAEILEELYPTALITRDAHLKGVITGGRRQVDVLLENNGALTDYEAKDHTRNIGVDTMAAYASKVKDENVPYAVMVSNSPFANSALKLADYYGVSAAHIIDTGDKTNRFTITQKVLLENFYIKAYSISIRHRGVGSGFSLPPDVSTLGLVVDKKLVTAKQLLAEKWQKCELSEAVGSHRLLLANQEVVMADGSTGFITEVEINYIVEASYHEGSWGIEEARGLFDVSKELFTTSSTVTSKILSQDEINKWPEITALEASRRVYGMKIVSKSG